MSIIVIWPCLLVLLAVGSRIEPVPFSQIPPFFNLYCDYVVNQCSGQSRETFKAFKNGLSSFYAAAIDTADGTPSADRLHSALSLANHFEEEARRLLNINLSLYKVLFARAEADFAVIDGTFKLLNPLQGSRLRKQLSFSASATNSSELLQIMSDDFTTTLKISKVLIEVCESSLQLSTAASLWIYCRIESVHYIMTAMMRIFDGNIDYAQLSNLVEDFYRKSQIFIHRITRLLFDSRRVIFVDGAPRALPVEQIPSLLANGQVTPIRIPVRNRHGIVAIDSVVTMKTMIMTNCLNMAGKSALHLPYLEFLENGLYSSVHVDINVMRNSCTPTKYTLTSKQNMDTSLQSPYNSGLVLLEEIMRIRFTATDCVHTYMLTVMINIHMTLTAIDYAIRFGSSYHSKKGDLIPGFCKRKSDHHYGSMSLMLGEVAQTLNSGIHLRALASDILNTVHYKVKQMTREESIYHVYFPEVDSFESLPTVHFHIIRLFWLTLIPAMSKSDIAQFKMLLVQQNRLLSVWQIHKTHIPYIAIAANM